MVAIVKKLLRVQVGDFLVINLLELKKIGCARHYDEIFLFTRAFDFNYVSLSRSFECQDSKILGCPIG